MAEYFKRVNEQTVGFVKSRIALKDQSNSEIFNLTASNMKFTLAERTDLFTREWGNIFSTFKLPITTEQQNRYSPVGTFGNTAFSHLNQDRLIFINIPKGQYGEIIIGNNIDIRFPTLINGVTTPISIRSVYFNPDRNNPQLNLRQMQLMDQPYFLDSNSEGVVSERISPSSIHASTGKVDSLGESNVVYLFSDFISPPITGGSWHTGTVYNPQIATPSTVRSKAIFNGPIYDTPVGIAYLDRGFIAITNPVLVNNFPWSATTTDSGDPFTEAFINNTNYFVRYQSFNTEFVQNIICTALPNEFFTTDNPTYTQEMIDRGDPVYITEIVLYNEDQEPIAIVKPSQPIPKTRNSLVALNVQIKV